MDRIRIPTGLLPNGFRLSRERYTSVTVLGPGDVVTVRDREAGGDARDQCSLRSVQTGLPAGPGDLTPPRGADSSYRSYRPPGGLALVRCRRSGGAAAPEIFLLREDLPSFCGLENVPAGGPADLHDWLLDQDRGDDALRVRELFLRPEAV
jgi:hypothetical protein